MRSGEHAGRGFHVFCAMGVESGHRPRAPKPWRLEPFPRKDQAAWEEFFSSLEGAPQTIVSDADHALARAVRSVFGESGPEHRLCEWHLGRKLREHLPEAVLEDRFHPVNQALPGAFRGPGQWESLLAAIDGEPPAGHSMGLARGWLERYGERIAAQVAARDPRSPNSTGPVEQVLREVDRRIGDRVGSFTNRTRMSKLLALMALELGGEADGRLWADRLRERLYLAAGRAAVQRPHDDTKGTHSLFA